MAIYSDDFQGYAVGAVSPFGSLTTTGFFQSTIIDSPVGIFGAVKSVQIPGISGLRFTQPGIYVPASSTFFGAYFTSFENNVFQVLSGGTQIGLVQTNPDGTISLYFGVTRVAASTQALNLDAWQWFQVNFSFVDVGGFVQLSYNIAVNEVSILSGTYLSGTLVSSLAGLGAEAWEFTARYNMGRMTIDLLRSIGDDPNPGAPEDRVTQGTLEQFQVPSSGLLRVTQGTLEQLQIPSDAEIRVTQGTIELYVGPAPLEVLCSPTVSGTVGIAYVGAVVASGGVPPYTYAITAGALPPGLSLNTSTGDITGVPTLAGNYTYTVTVTGADSATAFSLCTGITGITIADTGLCAPRIGPMIYFWEPSFLEKPEDTAMRATDWDNAGLEGAKFLQGFTLEADTEGEDKVIVLQGDQADLQTYTINHDGQLIKPYVFNPAKVASLVRLISTDDVAWRYFNIRLIWEPLPELVTYYETQGTTHDIPGYQFLKDGYISLISTDVVTLTVTVDGVDYVYTIPSTGGAHAKTYMIFGINNVTGRTLKGKEYRYRLESPAGFRLYQKDCEVRVHAWSGGDYQVKHPFGEVSRLQGAKI